MARLESHRRAVGDVRSDHVLEPGPGGAIEGEPPGAVGDVVTFVEVLQLRRAVDQEPTRSEQGLAEPREEVLERGTAGFQERVNLCTLGHARTRRGVVGNRILLEDGHGLVGVGEHARCNQSSDAPPDDDGTLADR